MDAFHAGLLSFTVFLPSGAKNPTGQVHPRLSGLFLR
jgi:hypothetical protein